MQVSRIGVCVFVMVIAGTGLGRAQTSKQTPAGPVAAPAAVPTMPEAESKKKIAPKRGGSSSKPPLKVIPLETAPPSPPTSPSVEAQQKAADQKLLEEQRRQSARAAQVTNQEVEKAQQQKENVQKEVRIQDAPGPAQTGVVPAAGAPVAPANVDQRIQDAPGPVQTLPQPKTVTPPLL